MDMDAGDFAMNENTSIVCLMCKSERKGGERLFMFGGNRPFMAQFEAKFTAFIGPDKLTALRNKHKTNRERSYICKHCYSVVDKTFDNIKKIQRGVAKSVRRLVSQHGEADDDDSGPEWDCQANVPKKKLPPVAERIAEKVASMTLVKINHKVPVIILNRITSTKEHSESGDCSENDGDSEHDVPDVKHSQSDDTCKTMASKAENTPLCHDEGQSCEAIAVVEVNPLIGNKDPISGVVANETTSFSLPQESTAFESSAMSVNECVSSDIAESGEGNPDQAMNAAMKSEGLQQTLVNEAQNSESVKNVCTEKASKNEQSKAELAEILANPLLMVKHPQPIKLPDVKNENVYICGEGSCDWIFSSKFFWENHIRHYHYYGKPHKCPYEGCNKYFPTESKQKQHLRKHTGERPFICEKCGKGFRGSQELRHHKGTHTVGKPYQCPKPNCYKSFKYINSMKRHLQYHDGNYPYPCTYPKCTKAFKNKYELKCHYRLHTGERPYKCKEPGCGKAFRLPCEYTKHRRAHSGERPFKCTVNGCSAAYITCNGLATHMLSHSNDQHFCCEFCGKTFKHKMSYRSHLKQHTDTSEEFQCKVDGCGKPFFTKALLQDHVEKEHGQTVAQQGRKRRASSLVYLCCVENCDKECSNRRVLIEHLMNKHGIHDHGSLGSESYRFYKCFEKGCGTLYKTEVALKCHRLSVHAAGLSKDRVDDNTGDTTALVCPFESCGREYRDRKSLRDHLAKTHVSVPREKMCPLCGQAFTHVQQLDLHMQNFHEKSSVLNEHMRGVFLCYAEKCGLKFDSAYQLKDHVSSHISNPPFVCEFEACKRTFLLEKLYRTHIQEHKNMRPHKCNYEGCQQGFTTQLKLLKHSRVHYGCFRCPIEGCGKMLQAVNSARTHMFRHTGQKLYACTLCGMKFATNAQWNRHKRTHTGEKPYECDVCHTKFADSSIMKIHMRTHTGEKPFNCERCGQTFVSQVTLKSHMRIHTGELPFVCPEEGCLKAFRESGSLKSHMNVHAKPSHLCSQCGKVYKFSIKKHKCKVDVPQTSTQPPPPLPPLPPAAVKMEYIQQSAQHQEIHAMMPFQQQQPQQPHQSMLPPPLPPQPVLPIPVPPSLPPPQYTMNNMMMMSEPTASYVTHVEDATQGGKNECETQGTQDAVLMQDADRNLMISSPYYNYMILYDRTSTQ